MRKQLWKKLGVCVLSLSMLCSSGVGLQNIHAAAEEGKSVETKTGEILLDGDDIQADNVNGLTYKGFGLLTGNSTSDLLMDYKAENPERYAELMQYLFGGEYPIFTHVKLEMGNDRNNSTGSESATMRTREEKPNVRRNPGWHLAADAKKINPNLRVSILAWNTPTWVKSDEDKYFWYKQSILAGYEAFGFMVDYINPNTNEHWGGEGDVKRTKLFAEWIAAETAETITDAEALELFQEIKLVVSDEANVVSEEVAEYLKSDQEFYDATDVVGYHYKTWDDANDAMKWLAEEQDKEVWNSEEQATFSNSAFRPSNNVADPTVVGTGLGGSGSALEMGNTIIKSFVESRRGHVIYQPVIGSFYEGGQYSFKELVSARDPWSGWIHYDAGLLVLAHLSKFAVTGWENADNTAGIWRGVASASKADAFQENGTGSNAVNGRNGGENYLTLAAPDKTAFSTLIVNDSEYPMNYTLQVQNMDLPDDQKLAIWETRAADAGTFNENYMKCLGGISQDAEGTYTFAVKPYSTVTVTTLDVSDSKEHTQGLPVEGERTVLDTDATGAVQNTEDGYLYADDFEYKDRTVAVLDGKGGLTGETEDYIASRGGEDGAMARYTHTLNGAFEVVKDSTGNHVLRQQVDKDTTGVGSAWNRGDSATLLGDFRWMNYTASVDVMFERSAKEQYAILGIRQTGSSHKVENSSGYSFSVGEDGTWMLYRRTASSKPKELATGQLGSNSALSDAAKPGNWFNLKLSGEGNTIKAYINQELVASYQDDSPITSGRVALGSSNSYTCFDNLAVTKIKGYVPYYTEYLDNMETYDLSQEKKTKLVYNDLWTRTCADQGMYVYQRSMSYSKGTGAALSYTFQGTGLELLGSNKAVSDEGKANELANLLNVTVDGKLFKTMDPIWTAANMCTTYRLDGLPYGEHTVMVEVAQGSLAVDAVAVLGKVYGVTEQKPGGNTNAPSASPAPTKTPDTGKQTDKLAKGSTCQVGGASYVVTNPSAKTVSYRAPKKNSAKSITIPETIKVTIGGRTVKFKVTAVSAKAFSKCKKVTKITIGKQVETIEKEAFKNCKALRKIAIKSTKLKKVGNNAVKGIHKKAVITCGKKKVKAYKKLFSKKTGFKKTMKVKKG